MNEKKSGNSTVIVVAVCATLVILAIIAAVVIIILHGGSNERDDYSRTSERRQVSESVQTESFTEDRTSDEKETSTEKSPFIISDTGSETGSGDASATKLSYPVLDTGQVSVTLTEKKTGNIVDAGTATAIFSTSDGYDAFFVMLMTNESNIILTGAAIKSENCRAGISYAPADLLNENAFIDFAYVNIDNDGYVSDRSYEHTSVLNPEDICNCEFDLNAYSSKSNAVYYFKTDFTFQRVDYTLECFCNADYTASTAEVQQAEVNRYTQEINSGICTVCHGSGLCQVCYGRGGMSYNTYGQGGSGWVECQGCYGSRKCKYCGGTGKN